MKIVTFQSSSVLRKFTILFILMSILPISVLFYLYIQIKEFNDMQVLDENFRLTFILLVIGVLVGYVAMRAIIKELIRLRKVSAQSIQSVLGTDIKKSDEDEDEIVHLTRSFNIVIDRLKENIRNLEIAKKTLHSVLAKVGSGIASMENIDSFLDLIVETTTESFGSSRGALFLLDDNKEKAYLKVSYGFDIDPASDNFFALADSGLEKALKSRKPTIVNKHDEINVEQPLKDNIFQAAFLYAPLVIQDNFLGFLIVGEKKSQQPFNDDELNLVNNIALQTTVAIENSKLNADAERTYFETISALALAVEAKDVYSRGHLDRVADYAITIAKARGLSNSEIAVLRDAARLHDIGKIGIYDEILKKNRELSPEERKMMEKHPEVGESIIKPIRSLRPLCDIVRHHHEFLDGSGYPDKLKGEQISLLARILTVADIYDAITTDRPYRQASNKQEAKEILYSMKNKIDLEIVDTLLKAV